MSLESLRRLRLSGKRPSAVSVLVGKPPAWFDVTPPTVVVIDRDPARLDLRALVGLPIHLIDLQRDERLLLAAMEATADAGVQVRGAVSAVGSCGVSPAHEAAMRRYRECLL